MGCRNPHISQFGCELWKNTSKSLLHSVALITKIYFTKIPSFAQAFESLSLSADYWFWRLTLSTMKLNCSMHDFSYWGMVGSPPTSWKFVHSPPPEKMPPIKSLSPQINKTFMLQPNKNFIFSCRRCPCSIFILTSYILYMQVTVILVLQNVVFSFEIGLNGENHSSTDFHHPMKKSLPSPKFPAPRPHWDQGLI